MLSSGREQWNLMCKAFIRGACERKCKAGRISSGGEPDAEREEENAGWESPRLLCNLRKVCPGLEPNLDSKVISCLPGSRNLST